MTWYILRAHREIFSETCYSKPNLDSNYHFSIDLVSNGVLFGANSIRKWVTRNGITRFRKDFSVGKQG